MGSKKSIWSAVAMPNFTDVATTWQKIAADLLSYEKTIISLSIANY